MVVVTAVEWTVTPLSPPCISRHCPGCGVERLFATSSKFRLNANGRKLDAWLIYRCEKCAQTWNRTIFERRPADRINRDLLHGLQSNDPALADHFAHDVTHLQDRNICIVPSGGVSVTATLVSQACQGSAVEIMLSIAKPVSVRLDTLLARGLGVSRSRLEAMVAAKDIRIICSNKSPLRRPAFNGCRIWLNGGILLQQMLTAFTLS